MTIIVWILSSAGLGFVFRAARRHVAIGPASAATVALTIHLCAVGPTWREALGFAAAALTLEWAAALANRDRRIAFVLAALPALAIILVRPGWPTIATLVDVLFCTQHGALATSAVLWLGTAGVIWHVIQAPRQCAWSLVALGFVLVAIAAGHRADLTWRAAAGAFLVGTPLLGLGLAWLIGDLTRASSGHPARVAAVVLAPLLLWNVTLMAVAQGGGWHLGDAVSFGDIGAAQAHVLHEWVGHPLAAPANMVFAAENALAPSRFDILGCSHFDATGHVVIELGSHDDAFVADGWNGAERDAVASFRWATREARLLLPPLGDGPLRVRLRIQPFVYPQSPGQTVRLELGGVPYGRASLTPGWQWIQFDVGQRAISSGAPILTLRFDEAHSPAEMGVGQDRRTLSAAVGTIEVSAIR